MAVELSEFASTLKARGTMLCLPLGRSLQLALRNFGFRQDQDVLVRFGPERLEILPRNTPREIQEKSKGAVKGLKALEAQVRTWVSELPSVSDEELEGPPTLEGELLGTLECLLCDDLGPAIEKLESVLRLQPAVPAAKPRRKKEGPKKSPPSRGKGRG